MICCFQKRQEDLLNKDEPIAALIAKGEDIISKCDPTESLQIAEKLRKLKERTADTKNRAEKRKVCIILCKRSLIRICFSVVLLFYFVKFGACESNIKTSCMNF